MVKLAPQHISTKMLSLCTPYTGLFKLILLLLIAWQFAIASSVHAATDKPLKDITFLGLKISESKVKEVRNHLWDIGGFLQAKTSVTQHNIDKFFPWSTIRDSYYVLFEYNHAGEITSVKRLFRPYSAEQSNRRTAVTTKEIARKMIPELGKPSAVERKGWGGTMSYHSYAWEDEDMQITIDREGSEKLGNVFIKYKLKKHDRFAVEKDENKKKRA